MKRFLSLFLSSVLLLSFFNVGVYADGSPHAYSLEGRAHTLKHLGLFKGVSENDFDLDRTPTRLESLVMLVRLMGEEKEALAFKENSPFSDVPDWGKPYVSYAYSKGYTKGVSKDKFAPNTRAGKNEYETFVLRALGYSDSGDYPDFSFKEPYRFAYEKRIHFDEFNESPFSRGEAAAIAEAALHAELKDARGMTLIEKLYEKGVISTYQVYSVGDGPYQEGMGPRDADVIVVGTVEELLNAVDDNTVVILKNGTYDITEYIEKNLKSQNENEEGVLKPVKFSEKVEFVNAKYSNEDYDLVFKNLKNFYLIGQEGSEKSKLICEPGYSTVITFDSCNYCSVSNLSIGHYPTGTCLGDVLRINNSKDFSVSNSDLYGCGSTGLSVYNTENLIAISNVIHDCSFAYVNLQKAMHSIILFNNFYNDTLYNPEILNYDKNTSSDIVFEGNYKID